MSEPKEKVLDLRHVFGLTAIVSSPASANNGSHVEMEVTAEPGSQTLLHYHSEQEETYQVLEGVLEVFQNGDWEPVLTGESMTISPRTVHGFRNTSEVPVRFINVHRPALKFQDHLEALDRLSREGKIRSTKDPRSLIYMSMASIEYEPDVAVRPPQWLIRGLAATGKRLRFKLQ